MKKPKKIMQIVNSLDCGGLEKLVVDLAVRFNRGPCVSSIICLDKGGDLAKEADKRGIKVIVVGRSNGIDLFLPLRLAKILKSEKADVVHTHNPGPLIYGTLAARLARIKGIVHTRHGREKRPVSRFIWSMNDAIVAISNDAGERLSRFNHINSSKIKIIHNGIDVSRCHFVSRVRQGRKDGKHIIGTVCRLDHFKDIPNLIESFEKLLTFFTDAELWIAGDGDLRKDLEHIAYSKGLKDKIRFMGWQSDIPGLMQQFDVFVLPSISEGISLALLEAMACGCPVVATEVGGNPEVVIDQKTGFLIPPKDPDKMADAIIKLLRDSTLAEKMRDSARKRVEENFSLERMVNEYEILYTGCLTKKYDRRF